MATRPAKRARKYPFLREDRVSDSDSNASPSSESLDGQPSGPARKKARQLCLPPSSEPPADRCESPILATTLKRSGVVGALPCSQSQLRQGEIEEISRDDGQETYANERLLDHCLKVVRERNPLSPILDRTPDGRGSVWDSLYDLEYGDLTNNWKYPWPSPRAKGLEELEEEPKIYFAQNPVPMAPAPDKLEVSLKKMFEKYRDANNDEKDTIGIDGTMAYLTELGVNLENASSLIPLEIVQAHALGEMRREEFVGGWKKIAEKAPVDTIAKQKGYITLQTAQLSTDFTLFKRVYKHTFVCSKEKGQRALPLDNAIVYWQMLFTAPGMSWVTRSTNWLDLWIEFLQKKWTKSVNKDMWNMTFEFYAKTMRDEYMSFWSEDGAWPGVIDDFVIYVREKRGQGPDKMEVD